MAGKVIAHLVGWYIPNGQPNANGMDGLTIDGGYLLEAQRMHAELERRARGQPLAVEIDIKPCGISARWIRTGSCGPCLTGWPWH